MGVGCCAITRLKEKLCLFAVSVSEYKHVCVCVFIRVRKILNLRVFEDENGRAWSRSVMDTQLEVLCVSQFTLQCILKGNKPDFHSAMPAELAQPFYNSILEQMRTAYKPEHIKGETELL